MALGHKKATWKDNQQKHTGATNQATRELEHAPSQPTSVRIRMLTDYRDEVKRGDIYETDPDKAAELIKKGRATEIGTEKGGDSSMQEPKTPKPATEAVTTADQTSSPEGEGEE